MSELIVGCAGAVLRLGRVALEDALQEVGPTGSSMSWADSVRTVPAPITRARPGPVQDPILGEPVLHFSGVPILIGDWITDTATDTTPSMHPPSVLDLRTA